MKIFSRVSFLFQQYLSDGLMERAPFIPKKMLLIISHGIFYR